MDPAKKIGNSVTIGGGEMDSGVQLPVSLPQSCAGVQGTGEEDG